MSGELAFSPKLSGLLIYGDNSGGVVAAYGQTTTATAADTVDTGLTTVVAVVAQLESDPVAGVDRAIGVKGSAGNISIKTFKPTSGTSTVPTAATTFGKVVSWIAFGTK